MSEQDFVVKDRRRFNPDGEAKTDEATPERDESPLREEEGTAAAGESGPAAQDTCSGGPPPLPEVNLATFVFSLGTSALMNLGELPDPNTRETCQNLPLAKQTIDILVMLQEKTQGNLTEEESNLLTGLLYELRMKYVAVTK